jgi:hypothetical protein
MEKYRTKKVNVKVYRYRKTTSGWTPEADPSDLTPTESVNLVFIRKTETEDAASNFVVIVKGSDAEPAEIQLVTGTYDVQAQLMLELPAPGLSQILIPKSDRKECAIGTIIGCSEYTLPEIKFEDLFPEGGAYLDGDHGGSWVVPGLDTGDSITFFVIASPGSSFSQLVHEDLEEMGKIEYYSTEKRALLEPVIG